MPGPFPAGNSTSNLIQANVTHFNKKFRENLKHNTPFVACATPLDQPLNSGIKHDIFQYGNTSTGQPLGANTVAANEGAVGNPITVGVLSAEFVISEFSDYANFSSLSLATALDNVVENVGKEMSYRAGETLSALVRLQADSAPVLDGSALIQLAATNTSTFTTLTRSAIASAVQSMAGRGIHPEGESFIGVIHPFAVGDCQLDTNANGALDIWKRTREGQAKMEELASTNLDEMIELPATGVRFFQSALVTTTPNYKSINGLTALRTYIFGQDGVFRVRLGAAGATEYGDGRYQNIKVYLKQNAEPTQSDPAAMVPGWASYHLYFSTGLGPDKTARVRLIDSASAVS